MTDNVMPAEADWYAATAAAMKKRETALNGIARWQEKLNEAELEIKSLMGLAQAPTEPTSLETVELPRYPVGPEIHLPDNPPEE